MEEKVFKRIIEDELKSLLKQIGCVVIEGPKMSGKTFLGINHSQSQFYTQELGTQSSVWLHQKGDNPIFDGPKPRLIDEWQLVPQIWDKVRFLVDQAKGTPGLFILTGSSNASYELVNHSGAGRMAWLQMQTLTFSEILTDQAKIRLRDLFEQKQVNFVTNQTSFDWMVEQLIKGGWPAVHAQAIDANTLVKNYILSLSKINDTNYNNFNLDPKITLPILRSIARLNSSQIKLSTILADIDHKISRETLQKYLLYFKHLFLTFELNPWISGKKSELDNTSSQFEFISKAKIRTTPRTYWCDPSIGVYLLGIKTKEKFIQDFNTLGIYFENQVIKDLLVYAQALDAQLYFYRDENNLEVDAIMELADGTWGAIEIKLGSDQAIKEATKNLLRFSDYIQKRTNKKAPAFLLIITAGHLMHAYQQDNGVYVIPHACLGC